MLGLRVDSGAVVDRKSLRGLAVLIVLRGLLMLDSL